MTVLFFRRACCSLLVGWLLLLSLSTAGCSTAKGDLCGKVSYNGKPLTYGSVLLIGADAKPRTTWIQEDGSYHFADVPVGEAKLAVYSSDPAQQDKWREEELRKWESVSKMPPSQRLVASELPALDRTEWLAIPAEYGDVDGSGLRVTINPGPNTYPIEMK